MFDSFFNGIKYLVTLRFSILTIFITLFVSTVTIIATINYIYSARTLLFVANKLMKQSSLNLHNEFINKIEKAMYDNETSAKLVEQNLLNPKSIPDMVEYTLDIANNFYIAQGTYWGDEDGSFIDAEYVNDDSVTSEAIDRSKKPYKRELIYRKVDGTIIKKENAEQIAYDPRTRPWYIQAKEAKKTILTEIYRFKANNVLGMTFATPVYTAAGKLRGVFGVDISLDWLSWYINQQRLSKNEVVFIIDDEGKLIASSKQLKNSELKNIDTITFSGLAKAHEIYKRTGQKSFSFDYDGNTYLANFKLIPPFSQRGWIIGIVIPRDDIVGGLKKGSFIVIGMSLLVLLLGILLVSKFINRVVVKPIKKLVKQTERIKRFELDLHDPVKSRIKEVILLANSIRSMTLGLKSFQKFVPISLVRQLIEAGNTATIGGTKKNLTILFSDIKDFTSYAEKMDPDELLQMLCNYFDELSTIITSEKGTIDKYIGDSIMAFWGAPLPVADSPEHAANAALRCQSRLNELNAAWNKAGKRSLITRFGIHTGEVVVGNVGSSERINYTVLGDPTNVASRLENLNKNYGTSILVTEDTYVNLKEKFIFRKIDTVNLQGKASSTDIYELLAKDKNELSFDIDQYNESFLKGMNAYKKQLWDEAILHFEKCVLIYPEDTVAPILIKRCKKFRTLPPKKDWHGVWKTKK